MTQKNETSALKSQQEVLVAEDLRKSYGPRQALQGLSFSLRAGRILGFLGPNGAGKTTSIRILTTMREPEAGRFVVAGISAYYLWRQRHIEHARVMFAMAMIMAIFVAPSQLGLGDLHGLNTLEHQPVKVSAMEGLWETQRGAPLVLFGWPDQAEETTRYSLQIPKLSSLILTHRLDGEVKGLNIKRKLSYLRRRSAGYNILQEEVDQIGAKEVVQNIVNLAQCEDGVYRVIICNARRDWETGYIDEYDLKLIPYTD